MVNQFTQRFGTYQMKDKPKLLTPRKKQKVQAIAKYLYCIAQDIGVEDHKKIDVSRAHIYHMTRKKMYAVFSKGCSCCRNRIDYTRLSLLFNRFGTPRAICKQCCDRKYGKGMWEESVLGKVKINNL